MKTQLLKELHGKATCCLNLIERAEAKRNYYIELSSKLQLTTYRNELSIWPCGRPDSEPIEKGLAFAREVLQRLDNRYLDLLDKITAHSIDNIKTL